MPRVAPIKPATESQAQAQVAALLQHLENGTTGPNCTIAEHGLYRMIDFGSHGIRVVHDNHIASPVLVIKHPSSGHTIRGGYEIGQVTGRAAKAAYLASIAAAWRSIITDKG